MDTSEREIERDEQRIESRAEALTADEEHAGSDDSHAQASAILEESDERVERRDDPSGLPVESGHSDEFIEP